MFVNLNNKVVNINHIVKIEHRNDEFGKAMLIHLSDGDVISFYNDTEARFSELKGIIETNELMIGKIQPRFTRAKYPRGKNND